MATEPPDQPEPSGAGHLSPVRAVLVLAGFLVAVGVLVALGTRPTVSGDAIATVTTTTVHTHTTVSTTTSTTEPHGSVTVLVANATQTNGLAAHYSSALQAGGWNMETPTDASTTEATSTVYYAAGQQAEANAIATALGLKSAAVQPLTAQVPVPGATGIDVVVVVGSDLVAGASS